MSSSAHLLPFDPSAEHKPVQGTKGVIAQALWSSTPSGEKPQRVGATRTFFDHPPGMTTTLVSLGDKFQQKRGNERRELVRKAVGSGIKELRDYDGLKEVAVDASADPHAAAVAAHLALYKFSLKTTPPDRFNPNNREPVPENLSIKPLEHAKEWEIGSIYAEAQNWARTLMELPANMCTPTNFAERVRKQFEGVSNVEIFVRDEAWAEEKKMNTFLSVTHGTSEPAKLVEIHYKGAANKSDQPLAFVGKGVTFDSGGISLKPAPDMKLMRADMGGAAAVVSAAWAIAKLQVPVNLVTVTPLTENMPGPSATKPGDIIYAMNGKSVEVDNTDAEGRLILADAIYYAATEYKPHTLIDVATLTGAMYVALGEHLTGVFSTSNELWERLEAAGQLEYDRFWRMPLDDVYLHLIQSSNADLQNTGGQTGTSPGASMAAALFLKAFAEGCEPKDDEPAVMKWAHVDMAGTMEATRPEPYEEIGLTGRPVRGLIAYVRGLVNN